MDNFKLFVTLSVGYKLEDEIFVFDHSDNRWSISIMCCYVAETRLWAELKITSIDALVWSFLYNIEYVAIL